MIKYLLVAIISLLFMQCAGGNARYNFDGLRYPVSMSAYLYDGENKEISTRDRLNKISDLSIANKHWGILYTAVQFSDGQEAIESLNREIETRKGDGVVNFSIENDQCTINAALILNWLPFWPGCTEVTLRGEIVKYAGVSK